MRPQQQNRRMRGRNSGGNNNNNNRKGPNPLTRNYESNGPDVKIRGSAQQIAEKYAQLARDAQSSGDRVMAENYLQHAEHYNRIIAAAQAQMPIQNVQPRDASEDDLDEERDEFDNPNASGPNASGQGSQQGNPGHNAGNQNTGSQTNGGNGEYQPRQLDLNAGTGPQPDIEGVPAEVALNPEASGEGNSPAENQAGEPGSEGRETARRSRRPRRGERSRQAAKDGDEQAPEEQSGNGKSAGDDGLATTLSRGAAVPAAPEQGASEPAGGNALAEAES